jgi:hypothetical protein
MHFGGKGVQFPVQTPTHTLVSWARDALATRATNPLRHVRRETFVGDSSKVLEL